MVRQCFVQEKVDFAVPEGGHPERPTISYVHSPCTTQYAFQQKMGPVDHSLGPDEYNTLLRPGQQLSSKVQRAHCHGVPEME